ncbi:MAG: hypothetical protein IT455_08370 [Planctomycetes bacterium]|nr:hypothetical protein [Planctomycetota bacterium]
MPASVRAPFAVLLVAACGIVGCASAPELPRAAVVAAGSRAAVRYEQPGSRLVLTLQNESAGPRSVVYSASGTDPGLKVVADASLQALLDVFAAKGLFTMPGSEPGPGTQDVLRVEVDGRRWTWTRRRFGDSPADQAVVEAKAYFLELYNQSLATHSVSGERPDFRDENSRARDDAAAARRRLQSSTGAPR